MSIGHQWERTSLPWCCIHGTHAALPNGVGQQQPTASAVLNSGELDFRLFLTLQESAASWGPTTARLAASTSIKHQANRQAYLTPLSALRGYAELGRAARRQMWKNGRHASASASVSAASVVASAAAGYGSPSTTPAHSSARAEGRATCMWAVGIGWLCCGTPHAAHVVARRAGVVLCS